MKKWMMIVFALAGLALAACSSPTAANQTPAVPVNAAATNAAPAAGDLSRTSNEASVTVVVTPLNLEDKSAATLDFDVAMDTHSVDLGYDLTTIATLSSDTGEKVQPIKWDGPAGGGHHREGALSFPQLKQRGQTLTLTLRGIADVPERIFNWKVN
jgi:hypothetical protein